MTICGLSLKRERGKGEWERGNEEWERGTGNGESLK